MNAAIPIPSGAVNPRVNLSMVKKGKLEAPIRVVSYGPAGVGKSTFASLFPRPLFIGAEDGTAQLDVERVEPREWSDIMSLVAELTTAQHGYRTLVIDTADWAEPLCWEHVSRVGGKKNIEAFGYGKGYVAALDEWRRLTWAIDRLRERRGMGVVILAHSKVATFKNPEGDDFDRYTLKLHEKAAGLLIEWSDAVLFCQYETFTHEKNEKTKGISSGARIMRTVRHAAYDAKNRFNLPEEMPLSYEEFAEGVRGASAEKILASFEALIPSLAEDDQRKALAAIERAAGDATKLAQLGDWVRGKLQIEGQQTKESDQ